MSGEFNKYIGSLFDPKEIVEGGERMEYGRDFRQDVKLDKYNLAEEAEIQAALVQFWTEKLSDAMAAKDAADAELDLTEATVNLNYRRNPIDGFKVTEEVVKNWTLTHEDVVKARQKYLDACDEVNVLKSAVDSIRAKGDMIKVEKDLFIAGYFADKSGKKANPNQASNNIAE